MGLRTSSHWTDLENRDLLLELMTKGLENIYFPFGMPEVSYASFQRKSARSDLMGEPKIDREVRKVQPGNSIFIVTCGHEGLSSNLRSWEKLADTFPHLTIFIGICWEERYLVEELRSPIGHNTRDIGGLVGTGKPNPKRAWSIFSLDRLRQRAWENSNNYHRFLYDKMETATDGRMMSNGEFLGGGIRQNQMFFQGWDQRGE